MPRRWVGWAAAGLILGGAVPAGAQVCHPDFLGTRTLVVHGDVAGYVVHGANVTLGFKRRAGCSRRVSWNAATAPMRRVVGKRAACGRVSGLGAAFRVPDTAPDSVVARQGDVQAVVRGTAIELSNAAHMTTHGRRVSEWPAVKAVLREPYLVVLVRGDERLDRPDRLEVYRTPTLRPYRSFPLVEHAATLDVAGDIALFSGVGRSGVYALDLRDGRTAFVAPGWQGDTPQIEHSGYVYEDATYRRDRAAHRVPVKWVPAAALADHFFHASQPLTTPSPITGLSLDGPNVAVTLHGSHGECDQVRIWQVLWHDIAKPTMDGGVGCPGVASRIGAVAEHGIIARWIVRTRTLDRLVWSSSENCTQHLIATIPRASGNRLAAVAANGSISAFVVRHADGTATVAVAPVRDAAKTRFIQLDTVPSRIVADADRVLVLRNGVATVLDAAGTTVSTLTLRANGPVALRANKVVAATPSGVDVFDVTTGQRVHRWQLRGVRAVSVHYGIAAVTTADKVIALRLADGRRHVIARGARPFAAIGRAGVAIALNTGHGGIVRLVPLAAVERALSAGY